MAGYTVVLSPDPGRGGFSATCPAMPGAVSEGDTREEALANIAEAMEAWLGVAAEQGGGPLVETPELVAKEVAFVLEWRAEEGWDLAIETTVIPAGRFGRSAA